MFNFQKIFIIFSWFGIIMGFILIMTLFYWQVYPYKVLEFKDQEFKVLDKKVYQGEMVAYTSNYCKYMNLPATVVRSYVDSLIYTMPSTVTNREMGCNSLIFTTIVPKQLLPGTYFIQMLYKFEVNPIRSITILHNTEKFEVLQSTESAYRK